jgi:hypothetical protein
MDQTVEAKNILEKEVLPVDKALLTGNFKDNWTAPCARYEMAANIWREADADGHPEKNPQMLVQCKDWLDEVTKMGGFDLDARYVMSFFSLQFKANTCFQNRYEDHHWKRDLA